MAMDSMLDHAPCVAPAIPVTSRTKCPASHGKPLTTTHLRTHTDMPIPALLTRLLPMLRPSADPSAVNDVVVHGPARRRVRTVVLILLLLWSLTAIALLQARTLLHAHAEAMLDRTALAIATDTQRRFEAVRSLLAAAAAWQIRATAAPTDTPPPYAQLAEGCQRELGAGCRLGVLDAGGHARTLDGAQALPTQPLPQPEAGTLLVKRLPATAGGPDGDTLLVALGTLGHGTHDELRAVYAEVPARTFAAGYEPLPDAAAASIELLHDDGEPLLRLTPATAPESVARRQERALTMLPLRVRVSLPADPLLSDWRLVALVLVLAAGIATAMLLTLVRRHAPPAGTGTRADTAVEPDTLLALRHAQRLGRGGHWVYDANRRALKLSDELRALLPAPLAVALAQLATDTAHHDAGAGQLLGELHRAIVNECEFAGEYAVRDERGEPQWLDIHADASYNADGRYLGHIAYVQDITPRKQLELELRRLATTDSLTGTLNRGSFLDRAAEEIARARRYQRPLALIAIDLDHFKTINDRYGHAAGDLCLRAFADTCLACLRRADRLGRLGGEEFAVLLPETGLPAALGVAERIREHIAGLAIPLDTGTAGFTVSAGIARLTPDIDSLDELLARADRALYRAKDTGRNRVVADAPEAGPAQADGV